MLQLQLAESLHTQRRQELEGRATQERLARAGTPRPRRVLRVRVGWWLVAAGLRLAVWHRDERARYAGRVDQLPSASGSWRAV